MSPQGVNPAYRRRTLAPFQPTPPGGPCLSNRPKPLPLAVSPIAVDAATGAAMLGMGYDSFARYVKPHVRSIRRNRLQLFPVAELERWARESAESVL